MGELLGYARVSTLEQDAALQHDALSAAGCFLAWTDTASGALTDRPELAAVMDALRQGDTLVVWRLDRLGRSLPHLIATVRDLGRGGGVSVVAGGHRHHHPRRAVGVPHLRFAGGVLCYLDTPHDGGAGSGAGPAVMAPARTKQAARMVAAGTPLTEVADVLGVSRTTVYRHLETTRPDGTVSAVVPTPVVVRSQQMPVVGERSRAYPSCGHEPFTREEAVQLRADLAVLWLHPDPENPGAVVEARHCRSCYPLGPVVDVECARCGDGPVVTGALAQDSASGSVAYPARRWLVAAGWSTEPDLVCPEHGQPSAIVGGG